MSEHPRLKPIALQSRDAIELLSDKWRIAILHLLESGALRTHELQSAMEEVSPKMLTQTLRGMERDGLVNRTVHPVASFDTAADDVRPAGPPRNAKQRG